jgi:hypothetical protein
MLKLVVALTVGVIIGAAGSAYSPVFLGWYSLIPWGLVAVAFGTWGNKREALKSGVVYGFSLSFAFLVAGYNGIPSLVSRFPFFVILSLFGAICGLALSALGYYLKLRFVHPSKAI